MKGQVNVVYQKEEQWHYAKKAIHESTMKVGDSQVDAHSSQIGVGANLALLILKSVWEKTNSQT